MGDSRKYPYHTTSLQIVFVYKQVIWPDKFWPVKKPVWTVTFFLSSKIKNKTHLRHFGISVYTLQQNIGCKFEWLKSNESTECKINTSTRNGTFTNSKSGINYFLRWKWTNLQMFVPLVCLDSLNHKMYFVFSCISSLTWCLRKTMGKSHVDSLSA